MPKFIPSVVLAMIVSFVVIGVIRQNVAAVDSRIAKAFHRVPSPSVPTPDLAPVAMVLAVETMASASGGPAPMFAVVATTSASMGVE